jgi:hypothetical protein
LISCFSLKISCEIKKISWQHAAMLADFLMPCCTRYSAFRSDVKTPTRTFCERYFQRNCCNGEMLFRSASESCTSVSDRCFFAPLRKAIWYSVT